MNLGAGIPMYVVPHVAMQRGVAQQIHFTIEQGPIGGLPGVGGVAVGPSAILDSLQVFDWYDGGGIDVACLSFGEVDRLGNVNVARFGGMMPGSGGFINIVHAARKVVFCGTLTAKGLRTTVSAGGLRIEQEGTIRRFVADVELITFNGEAAVKKGQEAVYVTERAVFRRERDGLVLDGGGPGARRPEGRASARRVSAAGEPGPPPHARGPVPRRMTLPAPGRGSEEPGRPAGGNLDRSVAMETDVQDLARDDTAIEVADRGDSRLRRIAWASAPVLTFVVLIVLWGVLVAVFRVPDYLVPAPQAVIPKLYQARQALWLNTVATMQEIVMGFVITVVLSIPLGLVIALSLVARRVAYPVLVFIQLVPKIAVAPLFLVWFGFGMPSKVLLTVLLTFFPLLLASIAGFQASTRASSI